MNIRIDRTIGHDRRMERENMKLSETSAGTKGVILALSGDTRFMSRVTALGLTVGCPIQVAQNEKKQPVLIYARDTLIALSRKEAEKIQIGGGRYES